MGAASSHSNAVDEKHSFLALEKGIAQCRASCADEDIGEEFRLVPMQVAASDAVVADRINAWTRNPASEDQGRSSGSCCAAIVGTDEEVFGHGAAAARPLPGLLADTPDGQNAVVMDMSGEGFSLCIQTASAEGAFFGYGPDGGEPVEKASAQVFGKLLRRGLAAPTAANIPVGASIKGFGDDTALPPSLAVSSEDAFYTVVFEPGPLGITANWATGVVQALRPGGQGDLLGVQFGSRFKAVNGSSYSYDNSSILDSAISGGKPYKVVFQQDSCALEGYWSDGTVPFKLTAVWTRTGYDLESLRPLDGTALTGTLQRSGGWYEGDLAKGSAHYGTIRMKLIDDTTIMSQFKNADGDEWGLRMTARKEFQPPAVSDDPLHPQTTTWPSRAPAQEVRAPILREPVR